MKLAVSAEVLALLERTGKAEALCRGCRSWVALRLGRLEGDARVCPGCGSALEAENCELCGRFLHEFVDGGPAVRYVGGWLKGYALCPACLAYVGRALEARS